LIAGKPVAEIASAIIDYRGKTPPKSLGGVKLLTAKVIKDGTIDESRLEYISEETYAWWMRRGLPIQGDVLLTTEAPLGETAMLRTAEKIALAQRVILLRGDPEQVDQQYLFAALRSPLVQARLRQRATGTTVLGIKQRELRQVEIPLPPLTVQRKIAVILSAYDDLIENNKRRIKLLEEMAWRIYREWFVDFRYPGHNNVPLVDSELGPIPQWWEVRGLFEVADVTFGFPFKSRGFNTSEGIPVIRIRDIPKGQSETLTMESPSRTYLVENGDILVGMDGDFHMARWSAGGGWLNQRVARFRPASPRLSRYALYLALEEPIAKWNATIVGTTVAHLGKRHLELVKVIIPPDRLATRATELLDPIFEEESCLRRAVRNLRATRDLLLPRLISGEIDVTDRNIDVPDVAA
jgi:type I restriction enzyme S subunit